MRVICFIALFITYVSTAKADWSGAIEALRSDNMDRLLIEVKDDSVRKDKKNQILFLSLLQEFPAKLNTLSMAQRSELFEQLEYINLGTDYLSQYKLALIPRGTSTNLIVEEQNLRKRLEPIAISYAPAALHLYGSFAYPPKAIKAEPEQAIFWLKHSAELGNPHAAFVLGMMYLNAYDGYGCDLSRTSLCLEKDESKGQHWMEQAAKKANEFGLILGDFAGNMGDMLAGKYGNTPDFEQAYLWYQLALNSPWHYFPSSRAASRLKEIQTHVKLKTLPSELIQSGSSQQPHLHKFIQFPKLFTYQLKPEEPIISFVSAQSLRDIQALDIYADGSVHISYFDRLYFIENEEFITHISKHELQELIEKLRKLGVNHWPVKSGIDECLTGCLDMRRYYLSVLDGEGYQPKLLNSQRPAEDPRIISILKVMNQYFPKHFPKDILRCELNADSKKLQSCFIF